MSRRIKDAVDEINEWKSGKTKANMVIDGVRYEMTRDEHTTFMLGFRAGLDRAAKIADSYAAIHPLGGAIAAAIRGKAPPDV